jgi:hypothetical protein
MAAPLPGGRCGGGLNGAVIVGVVEGGQRLYSCGLLLMCPQCPPHGSGDMASLWRPTTLQSRRFRATEASSVAAVDAQSQQLLPPGPPKAKAPPARMQGALQRGRLARGLPKSTVGLTCPRSYLLANVRSTGALTHDGPISLRVTRSIAWQQLAASGALELLAGR